jgi:hypothetical protein
VPDAFTLIKPTPVDPARIRGAGRHDPEPRPLPPRQSAYRSRVLRSDVPYTYGRCDRVEALQRAIVEHPSAYARSRKGGRTDRAALRVIETMMTEINEELAR